MEGSMGMISSNTAASALHRKQGEAVMVAPQPREDAGARIFKAKQARPAANIIAAGEPKPRPQQVEALKCPRCDSTNTKFCYYNNHSTTQPRYFCKACRRYWTQGGALRNVPVGGGSRKNKKTRALLGSGGAGGTSSAASSASSSSSNNSKINLTQLMMMTMPAALTAAPATDFPNVLPTTFMSGGGGGGGGGFELPTAMDMDHQVPGLPFTPLLPATSNNGGGSGGAQPLFMDMLGGGSFFNSSTTNTFGINLPFPLAPFGAMPPMRGHGMDASSNNHHAAAATQLAGHLQGADQEVKPMAGGGGVQWSPSSQHGNINDGGFAE